MQRSPHSVPGRRAHVEIREAARRRWPRLHPRVEVLEDRRLLAALIGDDGLPVTALDPPPTAIIDGTAWHDLVDVHMEAGKVVATMTSRNNSGAVVQTRRLEFSPGSGLEIVFRGKEGNDQFTNNTAFRSTAFGDAGSDILRGGSNVDHLFGGSTTTAVGSGGDQLFGNGGDDYLDGADGNDLLDGGDGNDLMLGGDGNDILRGGAGQDTLHGEGMDGQTGNDNLFGGDGDDIIFAGAGNDYLDAGAGNDYLDAGAGGDVLYGGAGNDVLYADAGADRLWGGPGNDRLVGGDDADFLYGGDGDDSLDGSDGADALFGEAGWDRFWDDNGTRTDLGRGDTFTAGHFGWFDMNLDDAAVRTLSRYLYRDGLLDRSDMLAIFRRVRNDDAVSAIEVADLQKFTGAGPYTPAPVAMPEHVRVLTFKVTKDDPGNVFYGGTPLGNLQAGPATQLTRLVSKWFLGLDHPEPTSPGGMFTYQPVNGILFEDGPSYQDVDQGFLNDCYLLAALAETACRQPDAIRSMFIDNGDGTWTVRFYRPNFGFDYVTVDNYLPVVDSFLVAHFTERGYGEAAYAGFGGTYSNSSAVHFNELWVALAEKAFAQWLSPFQLGDDGQPPRRSSYRLIDNAFGDNHFWPAYVLRALTGRLFVESGDESGQHLTSMSFDKVRSAYEAGELIVLNTKGSGVAANVVPRHSYAVVGYDAGTQKFTLFNPWGTGGGMYGVDYKPGLLTLSWSQIVASFDSWDTTTVDVSD